MHGGTSTQHYLPTHPEAPLAARQMADEIAAEHARKEQESRQRKVDKANELAATVQRGVRDLIGSDNYDRFRHLLWTERLKVHDMLVPPAGLKLDVSDLHRERKERAHAFLSDLGVSPARYAELVGEGRGRLAEIIGSPFQGEAADVYPTNIHAAPENEPRAFPISPPYGGFQRGFHSANLIGSAFRGGHEDFINPEVGLVGHRVTLDNDDASDMDFAEAIADAQVAFWFLPPASGTVNMVLKAESVQAFHHLRIDDEWGVSDSFNDQSNFFMMHVLHPNVTAPTIKIASNFNWTTDVSQTVDRQFIPAGMTFFPPLSSNGTIPAGEWVVIRAGTRTILTSRTNDMAIHSAADFRWMIRSISIQMT